MPSARRACGPPREDARRDNTIGTDLSGMRCADAGAACSAEMRWACLDPNWPVDCLLTPGRPYPRPAAYRRPGDNPCYWILGRPSGLR